MSCARRRAALSLALAVATTTGCYESFTPARDAGPPDVGIRADANDPCVASSGARHCDPVDCPADGSEACLLCYPDQPGVYPGICLPATFAGGIVACSLTYPCIHGELQMVVPMEGRMWRTLATLPSVCLELLALHFDEWCVYADGTRFTTGSVRSEACDGLPERVCGPGCRECPDGMSCVGASEQSGLGLCIQDHPGGLQVDREWCGTSPDFPDMSQRCDAPGACLSFVTPTDLGVPMVGTCLDRATCEAIAGARPDRFRCE